MELIEILKNNKCLGIVGSRHTGKTTTLINFIEVVKNCKYGIYVYCYHEELKSLLKSKYPNITIITKIEELEQIETGFIFIDEFQTMINLNDRHQSEAIERLFNQLYQKQGVNLILCSTPEYYKKLICRGLDDYIFCRITDLKQFIQGSEVQIYLKNIGSDLKGMNCFNVPVGTIYYKGELININYDKKTDKKSNRIDLFEGL